MRIKTNGPPNPRPKPKPLWYTISYEDRVRGDVIEYGNIAKNLPVTSQLALIGFCDWLKKSKPNINIKKTLVCNIQDCSCGLYDETKENHCKGANGPADCVIYRNNWNFD